MAVLAAFALPASQRAMQPPDRYAHLLEDCAEVQGLTRPGDEIVVLADRGGVVLYYCDRRGTAFQLASERNRSQTFAGQASLSERAQAFSRARYLLIPFPDLLPRDSPGLARLEQDWHRIPTSGGRFLLYERQDKTS